MAANAVETGKNSAIIFIVLNHNVNFYRTGGSSG
jgi:hypothetical protein